MLGAPWKYARLRERTAFESLSITEFRAAAHAIREEIIKRFGILAYIQTERAPDPIRELRGENCAALVSASDGLCPRGFSRCW